MKHLRLMTRKPAKAEDFFDITDFIANVLSIILALGELAFGTEKGV